MLFSWERGFSISNSGILHAWGVINATHKQMISGEEMHTLQLIIHLCLALWLLIQWLVYKLIYNVLLQKKIMNLIKGVGIDHRNKK